MFLLAAVELPFAVRAPEVEVEVAVAVAANAMTP